MVPFTIITKNVLVVNNIRILKEKTCLPRRNVFSVPFHGQMHMPLPPEKKKGELFLHKIMTN